MPTKLLFTIYLTSTPPAFLCSAYPFCFPSHLSLYVLPNFPLYFLNFSFFLITLIHPFVLLFLDTTNLVEHFKLMTEAEVVYLLTTFANMARARTLEDRDFICAVVREIYEVSSDEKLFACSIWLIEKK